ncbi:MAG: hypothetical protein M3Y77_07915 [Actinomycetota bacterium]|nr:hypothetical protein [Actinomycetota bacterium]
MDRRFLKPGWLVGHLLVLIAVLVCLRLGVWQWHRTHDPDGTVQNLAYAILWPAFAIGFIYMWVRFLQLEKIRDVDDDRRLDEGLTAILTDGIEPGVAGRVDGQPVSPTVAPHRPEGNEADDPPEPENAVENTDAENTDAENTDAARPDEQQPAERPDVFIGTIDDVDDDDDPELAAYNRRLAALAQEDHRRAH